MGLISLFFGGAGDWVSRVSLQYKEGDIKAEYLLPRIIDKMLKEGRAEVSVLETRDKWFGVTYQEDKQSVMDSIHDLVKKGVYKEKLFS